MSDLTDVILRLIETVSPDDAAKLDEIDAWVWCWTDGGYEFDSLENNVIGFREIYNQPPGGTPRKTTANIKPKYTRSRDALKAIRPKGYYFSIDFLSHYKWQAGLNQPDGNGQWFTCKDLPTEELAELHAIIQAIAYERKPQS